MPAHAGIVERKPEPLTHAKPDSLSALRIVYAAVLVMIVASLTIAQAKAETQIQIANVDIIPAPDRQQSETTIAVDPHNPSVIVAGAQDYNLQTGCCPPSGHRWNGYYRSVDGGATWSSVGLPGFPGDTSPQGKSSPLKAFDLTSDPILVFDGAGNAYYAGLAISLATFTSVAFVAKYINDGADYSGVTIIPGTLFADKPWIAVDLSNGSNSGNIDLVFDAKLVNGPGGVVFSHSSDHGATFSDPISVVVDGSSAGVAVDAQGHIFVSSITRSFHEIYVSRSTDGGLTFRKPALAARVTRMPSPLPGNGFRTPTIPQIAADDKGVYVVWDDYRTGDSDVLFTRSTDGGTSWTSPMTVNDVTTGQQFFPSITSSGGIISVVWYDSQLGQMPNGTITGLDVFYAGSTTAGVSFSQNVRVTSVSFNPNSVRTIDFNRGGGPFIGDYIQVAASPGTVHPAWTDNRNACDFKDPTIGCLDQDVFTTSIKI